MYIFEDFQVISIINGSLLNPAYWVKNVKKSNKTRNYQ
jgi:hypothetical protein